MSSKGILLAQEECHADADGQEEENACGPCAGCEGKEGISSLWFLCIHQTGSIGNGSCTKDFSCDCDRQSGNIGDGSCTGFL